MADPAFEAAVAMLSAPEATPAAPSTDAPTTPAEAPAPSEPTTEAPAPTPAPVPEAPTPQVDEADKLYADLEARRQARQGKQTPDEVAQLRAELAELKAKLATPTTTAPDLKALIAEHGEVEGLRRYGVDPLEFFDGFRKRAAAQNPELSAAKQEAAAARAVAEALQSKYDADKATEKETREANAKQGMEHQYLQLLKHPEAKFEVLHRMEPHEALDATYKTMEWLDREGYDRSSLNDYQLATLVDRRERDRIRRLTGTDPTSVTPNPTTVPTTDGAKTKPVPPASLTNDLAAQSTGRERALSEKERLAASIRVLETGAAEA